MRQVRSVLPTMELDSAFEAKEEIALEVKNALKETMSSFGYQILQCLVTDLNPDGWSTSLFTFFFMTRRKTSTTLSTVTQKFLLK